MDSKSIVRALAVVIRLPVFVLDTVHTELLRKAMGLPDVFSCKGEGGGVIQAGASDATLVAVLAARKKALNSLEAALKGSQRSRTLLKDVPLHLGPGTGVSQTIVSALRCQKEHVEAWRMS